MMTTQRCSFFQASPPSALESGSITAPYHFLLYGTHRISLPAAQHCEGGSMMNWPWVLSMLEQHCSSFI